MKIHTLFLTEERGTMFLRNLNMTRLPHYTVSDGLALKILSNLLFSSFSSHSTIRRCTVYPRDTNSVVKHK